MNKKVSILFLIIAVSSSSFIFAQKGKKKSTSKSSGSSYGSSYGGGSSYGSPKKKGSSYGSADTSKPKSSSYGGGSSYGSNGASGSNTPRLANVPYEISPASAGGGLNDSVKVSKRNDNVVERNLVKDRTPLPYKHIREDDAVYKQRIWREIDAREKINLAFRYSLVEDNGSQRFISILLNAIKSGDVVAFDADADDRFTTPMTSEQAMKQFGSKIDTIAHYDLDGNIDKYIVKPRDVNLDSIYKFRIKEEVVFDKETSRLYTHILGIAPMMPIILSDGTSLGQMRVLFWLYYPDLRNTLAKYEVYNPKNFGARMSWEDLFESRMFSSYITKATLDNPFDQTLKQKYGKNSLFILLEGDAIKEKIFNYEQDLWSY